MSKNIAVILAGGTGQRLGEQVPKQFIKVAGKKVIEHTISVFQQHPMIDDICVVCHADYISELDAIRLANNFTKLTKVIAGGTERYESSLAAINAYENEEDANIIFHDSVRPLVNERIIDDVLKALTKYDAVDVAVPTTDTIIQVDADNEIVKIPARHYLRNGQTPQGFKLGVIKEAYKRALMESSIKTTDDCGVVLKYMPDIPIYVVQGEQFNMKLTYKEDIFLLDKLFQLRTITKIGVSVSNDEADFLKNKVIVVFGGTQGIGKELAILCSEYNMHAEVFSRSTGVNVANRDDVKSSLKSVYKKYGYINFVVDSAGVLDKMPLRDMDDSVIRRSIETNYLGCINVAKESYQYLKESNGSLLFYTSSSYTRGRALYCLYSSLKAAIVNLTQALAEEWIEQGVRVNCINPERTKTPMRIKNFGVEPENSLLNPKKVAVFSLKTLLSNMTGEVIDVKR